MDGFVITAGRNVTNIEQNHTNNIGGGLLNVGVSPDIANCTFSNNVATLGGGAVNNSDASPRITNCLFIGNTATNGGGGGVRNQGTSNPVISGCIFIENSISFRSGAAILNQDDSAAMINQLPVCGKLSNLELIGWWCNRK